MVTKTCLDKLHCEGRIKGLLIVELIEFKIGPAEGTTFLDNNPEFYEIVNSPGKK